ncbi:MAG TPA: DUF2064 domain-containing protein, partial [Thermoanaerobaculia bacterium]|nr:DUF2064 domain-containing protein [Thermoanaerobaculia bacterium]
GRALLRQLRVELEAGEEPPDGHHPGAGLPWRRQEGADLGERLYHGLAAAARHHLYVAAVGSDHPHLSAARVERAFALLEAGTDAVFGPAEDGGYYLVALSAKILAPALFAEIPWSSAETLAATLARCQELGLKVELLEPSPDVDTPADLGRLVSVLGQGEACCPETRRLLASWGRLSTPSEP